MKTNGNTGRCVMTIGDDAEARGALVTPLSLFTRLASLVVALPYFKGKRRIEEHVMRYLAPKNRRVVFRCRPGFLVDGDLDVPYVRKLFWRREIEGITTWFVGRWLGETDVFYDVGANVGYFTMLAASRLAAEGLVVAFEPNPIAREQLRCNLRANQLTNVIVKSEALGSRSSSGVLTQPDDHTDHSTLGELDRVECQQQFTVEVRALDDMVQEVGAAPTVIKMDVEGWEYEVIRGASQLLSSSSPPLIIAEMNEAITGRIAKDVNAWVQVLEGYGYRFLDLQGQRVGLFLPRQPRHWRPGLRLRRLRGYFNIAAYRPDIHGDRVKNVLSNW